MADSTNMEILVNDTPLEFELENEIPLNEVIDHITEWAAASNNYVLDYHVSPRHRRCLVGEHHGGGKSPRPEATETIILSSAIEKLEVQVGDRATLIQHNLTEISNYIDKVGTFIAERIQQEKAIEEISMIADGMKWCIDSVNSIEMQLAIPKSEELEAGKTALIAADLSEPVIFLQTLALLRNRILIWTKQHVLAQLSDEEIVKLKEKFKSQIPDLLSLVENIATSLTVGKEAEAMKGIEQLVEYFSELLALLHREDSHKEFSVKLVGLLNELTKALDSADLVTAADIIDYDIKDVLDEIQAVA